jgi:FxsC-like protein
MTDQPGMLPPYFFLSYAHSDPLAASPTEDLDKLVRADPDQLVRKFFYDLTEAVREHASRKPGLVSGFFDQEVPVGSDWKHRLTQALSTAQVFVPLYSVGYLAMAWPGRELACFRQRVERAGFANPVRRFVPVLWAPLVGAQDPPGLHEALASSDTEPDYAENGLWALLRLRPYRQSYLAVVHRLARQIVDLAEKNPINPVALSQVPDIEKVKSEFPPAAPLAAFVIEVAAPTLAVLSEGSDPQAYGETPVQWRPFPGQELPLAEIAKQVAERFDFDPKVSEVGVAGELDDRQPGIILIDPEFIASENGRATLRKVAKRLPEWVLPLVVVSQPRSRRTKELTAGVRDILNAKALPTESARRGARGVESLDEFASLVPLLVAEAERQYVRYRSSRVPPPGPSGRLSLRRLEGADEPAGH